MKNSILTAPAQLVRDYLKYMVRIESASDHTIRAYALDLSQSLSLGPVNKQILSQLQNGELPLPEQLYPAAPKQTKIEYPDSSLSLASKNRKIACLKSFLNWCEENQKISGNISHQLHCPKIPRKLPHFISVDEVLSVLKTFKNNSIDLKHRVLFLLLYGGGLRVSEACHLKWQDIDFSKRSLRILGKGKKERISIVPELTLNALKDLRKLVTKTDYVFGEKALDTRTAYDWIRKQGVIAGLLNSLNPHALRHSFATHLLSSGANLRVLQELLGHESLAATEKYTHLNIGQLAVTMDKCHPLGNKKN